LVDAVVADVGIGEGNNLTGVGRIRQDFLVAGQSGIEYDFANAAAAGAYAFAPKYRSVGESKQGGRKCGQNRAPERLLRRNKP
jgi:hypothetical protein